MRFDILIAINRWLAKEKDNNFPFQFKNPNIIIVSQILEEIESIIIEERSIILLSNHIQRKIFH